MNINPKFISIPPFISTSWDAITSIQLINDGGTTALAFLMKTGPVIKIPNLNQDVIDLVFSSHSSYLEEATAKQEGNLVNAEVQKAINMGIPMHFGNEGFQGFGAMQHNPEQADSPDMPKEVLDKIAQIMKALGVEETLDQIPKAEPHCNCMYCQVARAITDENGEEPASEVTIDEPVSDEELTFKEFDITQKSDQVYEVVNPLNEKEHYQVFLGTPIGCTCGKKDCEHIKAVLNS